jgi:hypothetical protein
MHSIIRQVLRNCAVTLVCYSGLIRPYKGLQGLQGPYKGLRPYKGLQASISHTHIFLACATQSHCNAIPLHCLRLCSQLTEIYGCGISRLHLDGASHCHQETNKKPLKAV